MLKCARYFASKVPKNRRWFPGPPPLPYQMTRVLPRDWACLWGTPRGLATPARVLSLTNYSAPGGYHRVTSPTHCRQDVFTIYTSGYLQLKYFSINFNLFLLFVLFSSRTQQLKGKGIGKHDMQYDTMHSHDQPEFYDPEGIQEDRGQMQKHRSTRSWTWHTQNKTTCTLQRQAWQWLGCT